MKCPADGCRLAETACQLGEDLHILLLVSLKPCQGKNWGGGGSATDIFDRTYFQEKPL